MSTKYLWMPCRNAEKSKTPSDFLRLSSHNFIAFCLIPSNSTVLEKKAARVIENNGEFAIIKHAVFMNLSQSERLQRLNQIAIRQMQTLTASPVRSLPGTIGKEEQE